MLSWELRKSIHLYLVEIMAVVLVYSFFVSGSNSFVFSFSQNEAKDFLYSTLASMTLQQVLFSISSSFLLTGVLAGIISSLTFSSEIESGLAGTYLSLPLGKATFFLGKVVSVFVLLFASVTVAAVFQLLIYDTEGAGRTLFYADWSSLVVVGCVATITVLFLVLPLTIVLRNAWVSSVASIGLVYALQAASQNVSSAYLPPVYLSRFVEEGSQFVMSSPATLFIVILYFGLFCFSYVYFVRRVQVS